jgi:chromosome segregation ATPase
LGSQEQHLDVVASTVGGKILIEDDPKKLLRFPATPSPSPHGGEGRGEGEIPSALCEDLETRKQNLLREINQRNLGYFQQEVEKLDAWADDLKLGLEQEIKEIDKEVKEIRRTAATAPTLDEKLHWQKRQRELEAKRSKLRRELFDRQDEIESQRNALIEQLEQQLRQQVNEHVLFTIEWELK